MAQLLVRDVPGDVVERLKLEARRRQLSFEAYLRVVLEEASMLGADELLAVADAIAARTEGRVRTDGTDLIRAARGAGTRPAPS